MKLLIPTTHIDCDAILVNTMKKTIYPYFVLLFACAFYSFSLWDTPNPVSPQKVCKDKQIAHNDYQIKTIVLDAGHGGKDAGCSGHQSKEKHIALNIVLKIGQAIERQYPHINVIYTRKTDIFIPLYQRAAIANKNNADLFISIHCNALGSKAHLVHGSETYVMGLHTAEHNLDVARRENESILLEENYQKNYQGFDPNSDEGHIFLSMFQNAFLDKSIQFAEKVESKIKVKAQRRSRGVKQAGFVVLKETTMPSVLVETGYLTHAKEEAFLMTDYGQTKIASAIFEAFMDYKLEVEDQNYIPTFANNRPINPTPVPVKTLPSNKYIASPKREIPAKVNPPTATKQVSSKEIPTNIAITKPSILTAPEQKTYVSNPVKPTKKETNIVFKIQLAASPAEIVTSTDKWSKIPFVEVRKERNLFKYLTGSHANYKTAVKNRNEVLEQGFNGAFIVAYKDGKRIPLKVARDTMAGQ